MTKDAFAHIEDKELLNRFYRDRNNQWLGILLERYTLLLFGVCMKYLKEEEEAKEFEETTSCGASITRDQTTGASGAR